MMVKYADNDAPENADDAAAVLATFARRAEHEAHVLLFWLLVNRRGMAWDRAYLYVLSAACHDVPDDLQAEVDALKGKGGDDAQ